MELIVDKTSLFLHHQFDDTNQGLLLQHRAGTPARIAGSGQQAIWQKYFPAWYARADQKAKKLDLPDRGGT